MASIVDDLTGKNRYDYFGTDVPGHRRPDGKDVKPRRSTKGSARLVREGKRAEAEWRNARTLDHRRSRKGQATTAKNSRGNR